MPRQSTAEIDAEIIDRAATLFARHGFERTSLQQVADAVGYTKAGLLHHFSSKQAILDAVMVEVQRRCAELAASAEEIPAGVQRDRAVVASIVDLTLAWPGVSMFVSILVSDMPSTDPALEQAGFDLLHAFGVDVASVEIERLIRIIGACVALTSTVLEAVRIGTSQEWRTPIINMTMNTLGHPTTSTS
jgi:AcrR family transcriptional regulator